VQHRRDLLRRVRGRLHHLCRDAHEGGEQLRTEVREDICFLAESEKPKS
jgi:hypothetical protein